jgi:hypothetical protein
MEEFIILANKTLSAQEENLYSNSKGAIVKTIILHNTSAKSEATLKFDSVAFKFVLEADETKILNNIIFTKKIDAQGAGINIHITALQT